MFCSKHIVNSPQDRDKEMSMYTAPSFGKYKKYAYGRVWIFLCAMEKSLKGWLAEWLGVRFADSVFKSQQWDFFSDTTTSKRSPGSGQPLKVGTRNPGR